MAATNKEKLKQPRPLSCLSVTQNYSTVVKSLSTLEKAKCKGDSTFMKTPKYTSPRIQPLSSPKMNSQMTAYPLLHPWIESQEKSYQSRTSLQNVPILTNGHEFHSLDQEIEILNSSVSRDKSKVNSFENETDNEEKTIKKTIIWEKSPKSSIVGGVISNLLKFYLRRKLDGCKRMSVSIGGNSFQLLCGKATEFRVHLYSFGYEGAVFTELWAHTTCMDDKIEFNLKGAGNGTLFAKRIPMELTVHQSEADANISLVHNKLTRELVRGFWDHVNKRKGLSNESKAEDLAIENIPPLTEMQGRFTNGLVLLTEVTKSDSNRTKRCMAMEFKIVKIEDREELQAQEADWPEEESVSEGRNEKLSSGKSINKWVKVLKLPKDIRFKSFMVDKGWIKYTYEFQLHL